ncbi:MAG: SOS response-associated peptidase [Pirellulaceae bacterium]|nr:SOS response-associated peptidase [Pirellulaceae bacterium]
MCGRFTLRTPLTVLSQQFLFEVSSELGAAGLAPRYNIAPTQEIAVVRRAADADRRELALVCWGLVPSWSKDMKSAASMINARAETAATKPAFRAAFACRRCLVLTDGYFEWEAVGRQRVPHYYELASRQPFAFAGLWESWHGAKGAAMPLETATILTTTANDLAATLHERMPVILQPADYDLWLDPATSREQLAALLVPYPAGQMQERVVSSRVNSVRHDDAECLADEPRLF